MDGRYVDNCSAWYCDVAAVISAAVMGTAVIRVIMVLLLCPSISSIAYTHGTAALRIADSNSSSITFRRSTISTCDTYISIPKYEYKQNTILNYTV